MDSSTFGTSDLVTVKVLGIGSSMFLKGKQERMVPDQSEAL